MFNALYDYFENIVRPTVNEYLSETGRYNIRRAKLAAIVLEHMIDYYYLEHSVQKYEVRENIKTQCPSYSIVKSVANATKHRLLVTSDKNGNLKRTDKNIENVEQVKCPSGLFEKPFGYGCFAEQIEVYMVDNNGNKISIEKHIRELLDFWEKNYKNRSFSNSVKGS